jgi:hypothetical protein
MYVWRCHLVLLHALEELIEVTLASIVLAVTVVLRIEGQKRAVELFLILLFVPLAIPEIRCKITIDVLGWMAI